MNLEEAKKLLQKEEEKIILDCTKEYDIFVKALNEKYNVDLNIEGRFLNDKIQIFQFFTIKK